MILLLRLLPFSAGTLSRYLAPLRPVSSRHSLDGLSVAIAHFPYFVLYRDISGDFYDHNEDPGDIRRGSVFCVGFPTPAPIGRSHKYQSMSLCAQKILRILAHVRRETTSQLISYLIVSFRVSASLPACCPSWPRRGNRKRPRVWTQIIETKAASGAVANLCSGH